MVWDLRGAMLKKQEVETARLLDFEFRERVRTMRLLAPLVDEHLAPAGLAAQVARGSDERILGDLRSEYPDRAEELDRLYTSCKAQARRQLIAEVGDPSPYRIL